MADSPAAPLAPASDLLSATSVALKAGSGRFRGSRAGTAWTAGSPYHIRRHEQPHRHRNASDRWTAARGGGPRTQAAGCAHASNRTASRVV